MNSNAPSVSANGTSTSPIARGRAMLSGWKNRLHGASLRRRLAANPENTHVLNELGAFYEREGNREKASEMFTALALICRTRREVSDTAYYCRKLELLGCPYRAKVYRELATLYGELGNYESAAKACAQVVDLYIAEGHATSAAGYLKALPQLGPIGASVRAELEAKVEAARGPMYRATGPLKPTGPLRHSDIDLAISAASAGRNGKRNGNGNGNGNGHSPESSLELAPFKPQPPSEHPEALIDQVALAERSFEDLDEALVSYGGEVFLSGTLGRITQFDIVQMVESNNLTGRLDITIDNELGVVFFDAGRIVASRFGLQEGHEAARRVFMIREAPFRVVITKRLPPDEFNLTTNTGFLLDILKTEDEENADPDSSPDYTTSPLGQSLFSLLD